MMMMMISSSQNLKNLYKHIILIEKFLHFIVILTRTSSFLNFIDLIYHDILNNFYMKSKKNIYTYVSEEIFSPKIPWVRCDAIKYVILKIKFYTSITDPNS